MFPGGYFAPTYYAPTYFPGTQLLERVPVVPDVNVIMRADAGEVVMLADVEEIVMRPDDEVTFP